MVSSAKYKEIKDAIWAIGHSTEWVVQDINNLVKEAIEMMESGKAQNAEHAALLVISQYY